MDKWVMLFNMGFTFVIGFIAGSNHELNRKDK